MHVRTERKEISLFAVAHPVLFAVSIFFTIMSLIHIPVCRYDESFNLRVFYARKRIRSELGLNPEDIGKDTPKGQSEDNNNN